MIFKNNVNLGAAFDRLKAGFLESERMWNDEETTPRVIDRLRSAYTTLYATLKVELDIVEYKEPEMFEQGEPVNIVLHDQIHPQ